MEDIVDCNKFNVKIIIICVYFIIVSNASVIDQVTDTVSEIGSKKSNAVSNLIVTRTLTDLGTSVGDAALTVLSRGSINDASSYSKFLFFSRETGEDYFEVNAGDLEPLLEAGFNSSRNTKILIPGWTNNGTDKFVSVMRDALLEKEDLNIFSMEWSEVSTKPYSVAYTAVPYLGVHTASFIDFLVNIVGASLSSIHLLGYSLGAHISGTAGEHITCGKLQRISGLDPAGPLFTSSTEGRLDPSDAEFVDVIHTTAGALGFADPLGTVDFYPNGGYSPQPGCGALDVSASHGRSYKFYAESVSSGGFIGRKCSSWRKYIRGDCAEESSAILGYNVDTSASGVYYLETNAESPFAKWDSI